MKKPLLILLSLLLVLALIPAIGLPLWSAREKRLSEIPDQGIYTCIELTFKNLPIPFDPDHPYRFAEIHD